MLDWGCYFKNYILGARKFILKDDSTTVQEARLTLRRLYIYEKLAFLGVIVFVGQLILWKFKGEWSLWHLTARVALPLFSLLSTFIGLSYPNHDKVEDY